MLQSQDIPFYIRVPESIPPTLALENGAGIKYELVGLLPSKQVHHLSATTPITIDKHELHSTWPVFQQHESRNLTQDAVMLTVDRSQNCYGRATVNTIFRAGPHVTGKNSSPQVKINIVGEQKVPVNVTMHGGQVHPLMGTGKPLIMELPVIVSNWPRRIGIAPSLSLQQPVLSINTVTPVNPRPRVVPIQPATIPGSNHPFAPAQSNVKDSRLINTLPNGAGAPIVADEMGFVTRPSSEPDERPPQPQAEPVVLRPGGALARVAPYPHQTDDSPHINAPGSTSIARSQSPKQNQWPTAEEEKARLYQEAKAKVDLVQGGLDRSESVRSANEYPSQSSPRSSTRSPPPPVDTKRWATAEEEKIRLFTQAQNNARIVQSYAQDLGDVRPSHDRGTSRDSSRSFQQSSSSRPPVISAGAALYAHAMTTVNKTGWGASGNSPPPPMQPPASQSSRLPTAAEEKEMLRPNFGPSDGVMPTASSSDASAGPYPIDSDISYGSAPDELPPPWVPSADYSQGENMSEKERYRIAYEARERAAAQVQQPVSPPPSASPPVSPPADYYTVTGTVRPPPWQPPPPTVMQPGSRAVEEKALLKAKYEGEETKALPPPSPPHKGHSPPSPRKALTAPAVPTTQTQTQTPPQTPPPLMPRPPASYIQETAEVDARLQDELASTNGHGDAHANIVHRSATVGSRLVATTPTSLARRTSTGSGAIDESHAGLFRSSTRSGGAWDSIARAPGTDLR
ncbi:hypothetical protein EI94DRAFT_1746344, partial [Lactarius quietus]